MLTMSPLASAIVSIVVVILGVIAAYLLALWLHPERDCPACAGGGKHRGVIFSGRRQCKRCGGNGRQPKIGTYVWEKWMNGKPSRHRTL